jgi:hypothetical protein
MKCVCHQGDAVGHPSEKYFHHGQGSISDDTHDALKKAISGPHIHSERFRGCFEKYLEEKFRSEIQEVGPSINGLFQYNRGGIPCQSKEGIGLSPGGKRPIGMRCAKIGRRTFLSATREVIVAMRYIRASLIFVTLISFCLGCGVTKVVTTPVKWTVKGAYKTTKIATKGAVKVGKGALSAATYPFRDEEREPE